MVGLMLPLGWTVGPVRGAALASVLRVRTPPCTRLSLQTAVGLSCSVHSFPRPQPARLHHCWGQMLICLSTYLLTYLPISHLSLFRIYNEGHRGLER